VTDYDPEEAIRRNLDQVVGKQYDPIDSKLALRKRLVKWFAGALFAIAAVSLVVYIIESHRLPREVPPRAAKPVVIQIVPEKPRSP
jgi:hypothetical protein